MLLSLVVHACGYLIVNPFPVNCLNIASVLLVGVLAGVEAAVVVGVGVDDVGVLAQATKLAASSTRLPMLARSRVIREFIQ